MIALCPAAVTFLFLGTIHYVVYSAYSHKSSKALRSGTELVLNSLGQKTFFNTRLWLPFDLFHFVLRGCMKYAH